jgi:hypothetical protein
VEVVVAYKSSSSWGRVSSLVEEVVAAYRSSSSWGMVLNWVEVEEYRLTSYLDT